jgi:hypothetical protein
MIFRKLEFPSPGCSLSQLQEKRIQRRPLLARFFWRLCLSRVMEPMAGGWMSAAHSMGVRFSM